MFTLKTIFQEKLGLKKKTKENSEQDPNKDKNSELTVEHIDTIYLEFYNINSDVYIQRV